MNTFVKILSWTVGGVIVLVLIAFIAAKLFFPVEKVKAMALEKAQSTLNRPISIGSADLSIWGGLGVKLSDLSVGNPQGFSGDPFLHARSTDVKVAFWPLLTGRVQVSRLVIEAPSISMHQLADGTTNYTFASVDSSMPASAANIPAEAKPAAAAVAFDGIEIHHGVVRFVDDSAGRQIDATGLALSTSVANPNSGVYHAKGNLAIDTLLLSFMQKLPPMKIALEYDASYDMNQGSLSMARIGLGLNGVLLEISGTLSNLTGAMAADLKVKSDRIGASDLIKLLPPDKLAALADFTVNSDFAIDASVAYDSLKTPALDYSGNATISNLAVTRKGLDGELRVKKIPLEFAIDRIKLAFEDGQFAGQPFSGNLAVDNFANPNVTGALKGNLDLAFLQPFLPQTGKPELKGKATVDLAFDGRPKEATSMNVTGRLAVSDGSFHDSLLPEPITHFEADMVLTKDTIAVNSMTVKFVSSDASFAGKLIKPFPYLLPMKNIDRSKLTKPMFLFTLTSHRFDNDKLFPEAVPGSGENRASLPVDSIPPIFLPDIDGQGTFTIDTLVYSKVDLTNIAGKIRIHDRKIEAYDVTGMVYTGSVAGNTTVDLNDFNNPKYSGNFTASQIEANDFIERFCKVGGFLYGKFDMKGDYNATGWEPDQFLNSMSMTSFGAVQNGKLVTSGVVYDLLNSIAQKIGRPFEKEQPLKALTSNIRVKDGKVFVDGLKANLVNIGDLQLAGFYGFDNQLGYDGTIQLTKELTAKLSSQGGLLGGLAGLLSDKSSGRLLVPLKVTGTWDKPNAEIDFSALTKSAGQNLKKNTGGLLENLIKKK
jgi:AsmA protein